MTTTDSYDTASSLTDRRFPLFPMLVGGLAALNVTSVVLTLLG
ncbi:hypothetical protein [Microvirga massiliensis]|nr:hypothetical protein [Microvirga massiliensis]